MPDPSPSSLDLAPLSAGQRMLWWLDQQCPGSTALHVVSIQTVGGGVSSADLRAALHAVITAHPVLRGHMHVPEGAMVPMWRTVPLADFVLPFREHPPTAAAAGHALLTAEAWAPFDLRHGPLLRAATVPDADTPGQLLFMLSLHHSVADGDAILHVLQRLADQVAGRPLRHTRLFHDWVAQEQLRWDPARAERAQALAHWQQRLADLPERPAWPWVNPAPAARAPAATASLTWRLDDTCWQALRQLARRAQVSDFCLLATLAAWLLYRIHGQPDVVLAYPVSQRRQRVWARCVGHMVNLTVLRLHLAPHLSFLALLRQAQQRLHEDLPFTDVPMELLIEALKPTRVPGRIPWAGLLLAPNRRTREAHALPHSSAWPLPPLDSQDHLQLVWSSDATHCAGSLNYATAHVPDTVAQGLLDHWLDSAHRLPDSADQPLGDWFAAHRLTPTERHRLAQWNATTQPLPAPDTSLAHVFAAQVTRTPHALALSESGQTWQYAELATQVEALAAHVAHAMQRHRIAPGTPVGLLLPRSSQAIVALLAVVRAGVAYLPLNPDDPPERLQHLLRLAQVPLVLSQRAHLATGALEGLSLATLCLDDLPEPTPPPCPPIAPVQPTQAAYVLFTSGSTGTPKAVAVGHRAVLRLVHGLAPVQLNANERVLHAAPLAFDASTLEIWGSLLHGATLVMAPPAPLELSALATCIVHERISTLWLTAALFEQVVRHHLDSLTQVRQLLAGGDVLPPMSVRQVQQTHPQLRLFNGYGPTETTTFATLHAIAPVDTANLQPIPIGRPIGNTRIHLLDDALRPVPIGHLGEICIAGDGVALGYAGDARLSAERFIPEPEHLNGRMYRSGDLGAWRADGVLTFWGRRDAQVKIRGHRVEVAEVEATLQSLSGVLHAAVLIETRPQGKRLLACVHPRPGRTLHPHRLASEAAQRLPGYMLPGRWCLVSSWPLDANGKLHRPTLQRWAEAAEQGSSPSSEAAPATPAARLCTQLQQLWAQMLELPACSPEDHFLELGGSSLSVARLCSAIQHTCRRTVPMAEVYRHPTPAELTRWLLTSNTSSPPHALHSPLVCLNHGAAGHRPLILIHGIDGGSQVFTHLRQQLPPTRPVYALHGPQPVSEAQLAELFPSLPAMAAFYAQAVMSELAHHATQHVVLAGFSAGCALLLPLRDALRLRGCEVDRLVVLDAPAPERPSLDELTPWMQPRPAEQGAAPGTHHALNFRRVFARCLMNPTPDPVADNTPLLAILVGRHAKEKQTGWQHFWPNMALHCLLLPQRQHHNFLHPPSDARIARALERWCGLPHA